jgi:hypothetical protein
MNKKMWLCFILHTSGGGLWSNKAKAIGHPHMTIHYTNAEYGELRVYFYPSNWSLDKHGLIYTDDQWLRELRTFLHMRGFSYESCRGSELDYSEQGMQGKDYVSLDVGGTFLKEFERVMEDERKG